MTSTEPMTYKPGPELDARLGRAFGWSVEYNPGWGPPIYVNQEKNSWEQVPQFSTTWEGMRLVVEEMQRRGWDFALETVEGLKGWVWDARFGEYSRQSRESAPFAVCKAAIEALESQEEDET